MTAGDKLSRRQLLAAGALVVTISLPVRAWAAGGIAADGYEGVPSDRAFNAFLAIERDGQVTFVAPSAEIGQGIFTGQAQVVAEELDCDFDRIRIVAAPVDPAYFNPYFSSQLTAGSYSTRAFWEPLRIIGAQTRARLIAAASRRWAVPADQCETSKGHVLHPASGRRLPYGDLAGLAIHEPAPPLEKLKFKDPADYRIIGKSVARLDMPAKTTGETTYGMDVVRAGMKFAAIDDSPWINGALEAVAPSPAFAIAGVKDVIPLPTSVAVLADNSWAALRGLSALSPRWSHPSNFDDAGNEDLIERARGNKPTFREDTGNPSAALSEADDVIDVTFRLPFLAHAPLEPLNATIDLRPDGCDIWVGSQAPDRVRDVAVRLTRLPPEKVRVWNLQSGGGFGRRAGTEQIPAAIAIAKRAGVPVKLFWSREQDMRATTLRPYWHHEARIGLKDGRITALDHRIIGGSVAAQRTPALLQLGPDMNAVEGARETVYDFGASRLDYVRIDPPVQLAFWRSVGPSHNVFVIEGIIEEAAERLGVDPVAFRRGIVRDKRARRVLDLAADKAGWSNPAASATGRGIALQNVFGGYMACVIEVVVGDEGSVRVNKATVALDIGQVVNPDSVVAQVEGGLIFGLTAALWGEITFSGGRMRQSNFHDYRMMRLNEAPEIDVHLVPSEELPGGVGEPGTSIAFPALAAAINAATGVRIRDLPVSRHARLKGRTGLSESREHSPPWRPPR